MSGNLPESILVGARIHTVRGQAVMLDSDLADVYGVETKNLNKAVLRNPGRFPEEFTFQLSQDEWDALRFQIGTLKTGRGRHRKFLPHVFTEHGAVMLASVLNSPFAVKASIAVVHAFVRLRHVRDFNRELAGKIDEIAGKVEAHEQSLVVVFEELKRLSEEDAEAESNPDPPQERIGFKTNKERGISGRAKKRSNHGH